MDRDLGKFSDEQLCSMAASGDDSAMAELISRITPLAGAKAAMYNNGDIHRDDLFQEGMIAFITAVNTYDPNKNASFRTYAAACINNRIISVLRSRNAQKNLSYEEIAERLGTNLKAVDNALQRIRRKLASDSRR